MIKKIHTEDLPDSWELVPLGEFVENEKGKKPKQESKEKSPEFNLPYIDIQAFEEGIIKSWTNGEGCRLCYEDDFLMVWDGSRSGLVGKGVNGALGSTLVRINFPGIFNDYAYYFLQSKFAEINSRAKGVGIPHVDPNLLWNYGFPIPPLNEQKRIVAKIEELFSELDSGIESLKTAREQLKVYRQAVLKHAFEGKLTAPWREKNKDKIESAEQLLEKIIKETKPKKLSNIANRDGITYCSVGEICTNLQYGYTASAKEEKCGPRFLRITDIQDGRVIWDGVPYCEIEPKNIAKYKLKSGDIVFARTGGTVGKSFLIRDIPEDALFASYLIRLSPHPDILPEYLYFFLQTNSYWEQVGLKKGGLQGNVNATTLASIELPLFSKEEQKIIAEEISKKFDYISAIESEIEVNLQKSEALRQSILKKAFSGQLVAQNPADEPASILLERIRSEKATPKPTAKKPKEKRRAA